MSLAGLGGVGLFGLKYTIFNLLELFFSISKDTKKSVITVISLLLFKNFSGGLRRLENFHGSLPSSRCQTTPRQEIKY